MRYGLDITSAGPWGRPDQIAELATLAEDHGWDGVFCEDYVQPRLDLAEATRRILAGPLRP